MDHAYRRGAANQPVEQAVAAPAPVGSVEMRSALSALYASYSLVGQTPPEPPSLRGRIGAGLVKLVQRMLFWYTPQIVNFQYSALRAIEEQTKSLESAAAQLQDLRQTADAARESMEWRVHQLETDLAAERERNAGLVAQAQLLEQRLAAETTAMVRVNQDLEQHLAAEITALANVYQSLETVTSEALPRLEREVVRWKPQQLAQERRISLLLEETRKRWPVPFDAAQMHQLCQEEQHNLDAFYVALEDEFRGSHDEIQERLREYLPILEDVGAGAPAMPILDVGCGRGEWLELLRQRGWQSSGVDLNRVLIAICQERGLPVTEADAIEHLRSLPEASLGAVTAFHLIEHLPLPRLIALLDAIVRVLKPGGVAIFETPNPNNVFTSSRYFYLDPTHRHPIPPQLGQFLVEARGLRRIEVKELHPWPKAHHVDTLLGGDVAGRFNECFYGPQDYAIIGRKV
jgi:O-antigen chain-terminating methyltransferase